MMTILTDLLEEEQFLAGEYVSPGDYKEAASSRVVHFDHAGYLPPTDGNQMCTYTRVAASDHERRPHTLYGADRWAQGVVPRR